MDHLPIPTSPFWNRIYLYIHAGFELIIHLLQTLSVITGVYHQAWLDFLTAESCYSKHLCIISPCGHDSFHPWDIPERGTARPHSRIWGNLAFITFVICLLNHPKTLSKCLILLSTSVQPALLQYNPRALPIDRLDRWMDRWIEINGIVCEIQEYLSYIFYSRNKTQRPRQPIQESI